MTVLPVELLDIIVTELHPENDSNTLKSLALSCRALTTPSQKLLFSHTIIRSPFKCCPKMCPFGGTAAAFKTLLDGSPHIANIIRCLEIFDSPPQLRYMNLCPDPEHRHVQSANWLPVDGILESCLPLLKSLQALTLSYINNDAYRNELDGLSLSFIIAIRRVLQLPSLIYVDLDFEPILSLLQNTGSSIKYLLLDSTERRIALENLCDPPVVRQLIYPESLYLDEACYLPRVKLELLGIGSCEGDVTLRRLKRLHVYLHNQLESAYPPLLKILKECASTLEEFVFDPSVGASTNNTADYDGDFRVPLDLSKLKSLKRFYTFLEFKNERPDGTYDRMPWLVNLLSNCSKNNEALEEIVVDVEYQFDPEQDDIVDSWNKAKDILLGGRYPKLRALRILVDDLGALQVIESSPFAKYMRARTNFTFELTQKKPSFSISPRSLLVPNESWIRQGDRSSLLQGDW